MLVGMLYNMHWSTGPVLKFSNRGIIIIMILLINITQIIYKST